MKKKFYIAAVLALCVSAVFAGCSKKEADKPSSQEPAPTSAPRGKIDPENYTAPEFSIKFVEDSIADDYTNYVEYNDFDTPYTYTVAITSNGLAKDFEYVEITTDLTEEGEILINEKKVLSKIEMFTEDTAFVTTVEFPEIMPNRAISYTDMAGEAHIYFLLQSGEDGRPVLSALSNE